MPEPILNPIGGSTQNPKTKRWMVCPGPGEIIVDVINPLFEWEPRCYFLMLMDPPGSGASSAAWALAMATYLHDLGYKVRSAHRRVEADVALAKAVVLYGESPAFWNMDLQTFLIALGIRP